MAWETLKSDIAAIIDDNGNNEITGLVLNGALANIIDTIGQGDIYKGAANTTTVPAATDGAVFYIAQETGTYTSFGGLVISTEGLHTISNSTGSWVATTVLDLSDYAKVANLNGIEKQSSYVDFTNGGLKITPRRRLFNPSGWVLEMSLWIDSTASGALFITQDTGGTNVLIDSGKAKLQSGSTEILNFDITGTIGAKSYYTIAFDGADYYVYKSGLPHSFVLVNNIPTEDVVINDWFVGSYDNSSQFYDGRIALIRIWDIYLTPSPDYTNLYNDGNPENINHIRSLINMELSAENASKGRWYDTSKYRYKGELKGDYNLFTYGKDSSIGADIGYLNSLPPVLTVFTDAELNLWFDSFIPYYDKGHYRVDCDCNVGKTMERSFRWTTNSVEQHDLTINIYDLDAQLIESKTIQIKSISNSQGTGSKQLLFIGDSTTDSEPDLYLPGRTKYEMLANFRALIDGYGGITAKFLGLRGVDPYKHQAHAGYETNDFITNTGEPNPFWDTGIGRNNFQKYMLDNSNFGGTNDIDFVFIQLGINDLKRGDTLPHTIITRMKTLIGDILDPVYGYPNAKIILSTTPYVGIDKTGWAESFFALASYEVFVDNMINLATQIMGEFWENPDYPNVYPCPNMLYVDRKYGYPRELINVSARSSEQEYQYVDSVHPDLSGYQQASDSYYSVFRSLL